MEGGREPPRLENKRSTMKYWKTAALAVALAAAAGLGAALAPVASGQNTTVITPRSVEILTGGSRLGVTVRDVAAGDVKTGQTAGVVIEEVSNESAAEKAGVRSGDIVVEFDGERVRSVRQFTRLVGESVAGRAVAMGVLRDGQRQALTISPDEGGAFRRLGDEFYDLSESLRAWRGTPPRPPAPPAAPHPPAPPAAPRPPDWEFPDMGTFIWRGTSALGMTLSDLSPQLAEYFGTTEGVLVTSVAEGTAAERAGLRAGDVVTAFNGATVTRPAQLRSEIQRVRPGEEFTIGVVRDKERLTLKGKADDRRDQRRTIRML
jgi:serine protease Do